MAEEKIHTDKNPKKDKNELTPDELSEIAGGQESNIKLHSQEQSSKVLLGVKLNHNQTLVDDLDNEE